MLKATQQRWRDLIDKFVSTKASHQVNIPGKIREALLEEDRYVDMDDPPPEPELLDQAEGAVMEMLRDAFIGFVERASATPYLPKAPSWGLDSDSGRGSPASGTPGQSCPGSPSMLGGAVYTTTSTTTVRKEYTSAGVYERSRPESSERSRSGSGSNSDSLDDFPLRKPGKVSFYRELAAKTASIVRISSSDKLKVSPGSSGRNSVRTSLDRDGNVREVYEESEAKIIRRGGFFAKR